MTWSIYILRDPRDRAVRYVGWTAGSPAVRLRKHLAEAAQGREVNHRTAWIRSLLALDLTPTIHVIARGVGDGWTAAERKWIARMRELGARLTNATDGGEGAPGRVVSVQTRRRLASAQRSACTRPDVAERKRAASRDVQRRPEVRRAISLANRGDGHPNARLTSLAVAEIRRTIDEVGAGALALRYGVTTKHVRRVAGGGRWRHVDG